MFQSGDIVERYTVELILGQGGMATVYRVRHRTLGTVHALKVLHTRHPVVRERLLAEGRAQARLRHPHIVAVTDVLEIEGSPALLMDYVGGGSLDERLESHPLPLDEALRLFRGVLVAVAYAHQAGVVHRDLKPANVLLSDDPPVPRVTDFGIAKVLDEGETGHTRTAMMLGTPAYVAPEQARNAKGVDARADLFSLGVILYELCCGQRPFRGADTMAIIGKVLACSFADPAELSPDLPAPVVAAIRGCLVVDPDERIPDCAVLEQVLDGERTWEAPIADPGETFGGDWGEDPGGATFDGLAPAVPEPEPPPDDIPEPEDVPVSSPTPSVPAGRSASAQALVTDVDGRGRVIEARVTLIEGGRGVWAPDSIERDAALAGQVAAAVALGPEAREWGVRWTTRPQGVRLHGSSIGLAVAVATRAARAGVAVPEGWGFSGGVDTDEQIASVGALPAKVRAAAEAGLSRLGVPAADTAGLTLPDTPVVEGFDRWDIVSERLFGAPAAPAARSRRWSPARLVLVGVVALAGFTGLFDSLDGWLHHPLVTAVRGRLAMDDVVVVGIDVADVASLRPEHPGTITALAHAGATVVLFDVALSAGTEHDDAIADAIRGAGVPVIVPAMFHWGEASPPASEAIAAASRLATVEARHDLLFGQVRAVPARLRSKGGEVYWHAGVEALAAHLGGAEPRLEDGVLIVGGTRNPTTGEQVFLHPTEPPLVIPYEARQRFEAVRGKVAVVGVYGGTQDIHGTPDGPAYGVEIAASTVQTLGRQAALRAVSAEGNLLAALVAGLGAFGLALVLPPRRRWIALLVPLAVAAVAVALAASGVLLAIVPVVLAGLAGGWAVRW